MRQILYAKLQKKYGNKFIARRKDRIVASGRTMRQLFAQLAKKHIPYDRNIIIGHVPPKGAVCIYVYRISA